MVSLDISELGKVIDCFEARSTLLEQLKAQQFEDEKLFKIRDKVLSEDANEVAYELPLPPGLMGIHLVFHVYMLKNYHSDGFYIIQWDSILFDQKFSFEEEPIAILDKQVRKLRSKEITSVKVQWKHCLVEEAT
ncbi:uncharacterized protein LOC132643886 [Lycium barbarum]|uniref:uncharacterized protein LOC132643886 n=1 Tax=Lycium barbarum TaxID=112863 RepID=UPI00293F22BA|nr:uncharacterized protein LOC132643886 [Lycium barbarum]